MNTDYYETLLADAREEAQALREELREVLGTALAAGAPVNAVRIEDLAPHAVLKMDGNGVLRTWEGAVVLGAEGRALRQDKRGGWYQFTTEGGR